MSGLVVVSCVLALAWLPIAVRFNRAWKDRKNPVSLAICAAVLLFAYTNILFAFALSSRSSWDFFAVATHVFDAIVVINFYVCFRWSDKKFHGTRDSDSIPTPDTSSTPRRP